jgi:hypothetical protein
MNTINFNKITSGNEEITVDIVSSKTFEKTLVAVELNGEDWVSKNIPEEIVSYVMNRIAAEVLPIYEQRNAVRGVDAKMFVDLNNQVNSLRHVIADDASKLWKAL